MISEISTGQHCSTECCSVKQKSVLIGNCMCSVGHLKSTGIESITNQSLCGHQCLLSFVTLVIFLLCGLTNYINQCFVPVKYLCSFNGFYLLRPNCILGTVLSTLSALSRVIIIMTICHKCYQCLHFIDGEAKTQNQVTCSPSCNK